VEGFYTVAETATILGTTKDSVYSLIRRGKLRRLQGKTKTKVWVYKRDVAAMHAGTVSSATPSRDEFESLKLRVEQLEKSVETLKLCLGSGAPKAPRGTAELLLMHQSWMDSLAKRSWTSRRMAEIADTLGSIREDELKDLAEVKGHSAWVPVVDLSKRMVHFVEDHPSFPEAGLGTLRGRLLRSRDRFLGLVQSTTKVESALSRVDADKLYRLIRVEPSYIDTFMAHHIRHIRDRDNGG
jgi:hypothetical protein